MAETGKSKEKTAALILAAGKGSRFGGETPKQFLLLDEVPMLLYSIDRILPVADRLIVVTGACDIKRTEQILEDAGLSSEVQVIAGGKERYESSILGLKALEEEGGYTHVLIHDAARCLVTDDVIYRALEGVRKYDAVVAAVPSRDTVKLIEKESPEDAPAVHTTPDRKLCFDVQTPQAFRLDWILEAYREAEVSGGLSSLTDDASAIERYSGHSVRVVLGSEENFKVTTPFDFMLAETILTVRRMRE